MRFTARHYATGEPTAVEVTDGRVTYLGPGAEPADGWVAPSFCDVQINGCLGVGFNSPALTTDGVRAVADECRRHGVGRVIGHSRGFAAHPCQGVEPRDVATDAKTAIAAKLPLAVE